MKRMIILPRGEFKENCYECIYADFRDKDLQGKVRCVRYEAYIYPDICNKCFEYQESEKK